MKYYNQVDEDQRARAAAVFDGLISGDEANKTDARVTPEVIIGQNQDRELP